MTVAVAVAVADGVTVVVGVGVLELTLEISAPGAVLVEAVGWSPIAAAKLIMVAAMIVVLVSVWWKRKLADEDLRMLRLAAVPLAAYLLLRTTVHPWYAAVIIIPLLPFLLPRNEGATGLGRSLMP